MSRKRLMSRLNGKKLLVKYREVERQWDRLPVPMNPHEPIWSEWEKL